MHPAKEGNRRTQQSQRRPTEAARGQPAFVGEEGQVFVGDLEPRQPALIRGQPGGKCRHTFRFGAIDLLHDGGNALRELQFLRARRVGLVNDRRPDAQVIEVEPFDARDDPRVLQLRGMQDERLDAALDLGSQVANAFLAVHPPQYRYGGRVLGIARQEVRCHDRLAEVHQGVAAVDFLGRISQADGHDLQAQLSLVPVLQFQGHPGGAGFNLLELRVVISDAFGKDAHSLAAFEHAG